MPDPATANHSPHSPSPSPLHQPRTPDTPGGRAFMSYRSPSERRPCWSPVCNDVCQDVIEILYDFIDQYLYCGWPPRDVRSSSSILISISIALKPLRRPAGQRCRYLVQLRPRSRFWKSPLRRQSMSYATLCKGSAISFLVGDGCQIWSKPSIKYWLDDACTIQYPPPSDTSVGHSNYPTILCPRQSYQNSKL